MSSEAKGPGVAAMDAAVKAGAAFGGIDAVDQGEKRRHPVGQFGNHIVQIPARVDVVAFFTGGDVNNAFQVFDAEADHGLGMGF